MTSATPKSLWQRYVAWVRTPMSTPPLADEQHVCLNCGESYDGNYCPRCGQPATARRFTLSHVMKQALDVWGLGGRHSMPRTLWHLLWRPGHMIADYLMGHRQPYFSPFKMLVLVTTAFAIFVHVTPGVQVNKLDWSNLITSMEQSFEENMTPAQDDARPGEAQADAPATHHKQRTQRLTTVTGFLKGIAHWIDTHDIVSKLIYHLTMALAVIVVFRRTPRLGRATKLEHFYAQVFIASQMTIVTAIYILLKLLCVGQADANPPLGLTFALFVIDYHQLYGYGWWKSAFKTLLCQLVYALMAAAIFVIFIILFVVSVVL